MAFEPRLTEADVTRTNRIRSEDGQQCNGGISVFTDTQGLVQLLKDNGFPVRNFTPMDEAVDAGIDITTNVSIQVNEDTGLASVSWQKPDGAFLCYRSTRAAPELMADLRTAIAAENAATYPEKAEL